jgi:dolichol-phosphate mannosyltransferase
LFLLLRDFIGYKQALHPNFREFEGLAEPMTEVSTQAGASFERPDPEPATIKHISIIIPVYNEEGSLKELKAQIDRAVESAPEIGDFEIIFVDDGSSDGSWPIIKEIARDDDRVTAIRLRRNFGKAMALDVGVHAASADIVFTMDADLQDDPGEIPKLLAKLDEGYDVVSGWKRARHDPLSKRLPSKLFNLTTATLTGIRMQDFNCGFKVYRREVFDSFVLYGELHRYIPVLAHAAGYRVGEMPVVHHPRKHGVSKYGARRYARGLLDLLTTLTITRYVRRPGHLFGGIGLIFSGLGVVILTYLSFLRLVLGEGIGSRPLLSFGGLLMVVGVQFLMFGMLAELLVHRTEPISPRSAVAEVLKWRNGSTKAQ